MSGFSGTLKLTNLDDFITPSQACIKPVSVEKLLDTKGSAKIAVQPTSSYNHESTADAKKLEKVDITLQDCLACSGCITSAETILINQQSQEELMKVLRHNNFCKSAENINGMDAKVVVFTISQQPVLSLAYRYGLTIEKTAAHLSGYFRHLGADYVLNTKIADDLALLECREEFLIRYRSLESFSSKEQPLPMLSSSCPGWVCYAEKTHGQTIIPHIATTRSPQQIMGIMVKKLLAEKLNVQSDQIYHITLMPCFDKKLEASRKDFFHEVINSPDVDCVITSIEVEQMLENNSLETYPSASIDFPWWEEKEQNHFIWANESSTSGGYSEHIFKYAAQKLFNVEIHTLQYKILRNPDFREITLEDGDKCLLRFAIVNGFRNIQNLIQKIKRGKVIYHFVEVMACPSGCINGGAQIRPQHAGQPMRELTSSLEQLYRKLPQSQPENDVCERIYRDFLHGKESDRTKKLLHTKYRAVEKMNTVMNIKW